MFSFIRAAMIIVSLHNSRNPKTLSSIFGTGYFLFIWRLVIYILAVSLEKDALKIFVLITNINFVIVNIYILSSFVYLCSPLHPVASL